MSIKYLKQNMTQLTILWYEKYSTPLERNGMAAIPKSFTGWWGVGGGWGFNSTPGRKPILQHLIASSFFLQVFLLRQYSCNLPYLYQLMHHSLLLSQERPLHWWHLINVFWELHRSIVRHSIENRSI